MWFDHILISSNTYYLSIIDLKPFIIIILFRFFPYIYFFNIIQANTITKQMFNCDGKSRKIATTRSICIMRSRQKKLGMHRVAAKFVRRLMSQDRKNKRATICRTAQIMMKCSRSELLRVTKHGTSCRHRQKSKVRSSRWVGKCSSRSIKTRQVRSKV